MQANFYPPNRREGKILAFADVTLSEGLIVRGFRIVDGVNGLFAAVPSRAVTVGGKVRFWNQVQFVSADARERILGHLLDQYHGWCASRDGKATTSAPRTDSGAADPLE